MKRKYLITLAYFILIFVLGYFPISNFIHNERLIHYYPLDDCTALAKLNPHTIIEKGKQFNTPQLYNTYVNAFLDCKNMNIVPYIMLTYHDIVLDKTLHSKQEKTFFQPRYITSVRKISHLLDFISLTIIKQDKIYELLRYMNNHDISCIDSSYFFWLKQYNANFFGKFNIVIPDDIPTCRGLND